MRHKKLLQFQEITYISQKARKEVIQAHHDESMAEHFRIKKTTEKIA